MKPIFIKAMMGIVAFCFSVNLIAQDRPNIVWLVSEDNSTHYCKLYNEQGAVMPAVESLAEKGIVFNNAFANAPVCSASRSTIISGCYGPRTFTNFHRKSVAVNLPDGLHMFPKYLREAGYFTTNNSKEDYNYIKEDDAWDESSRKASYRDRKKGQPFFHVQNYGTTHEGRLHFPKEDIKNVPTQHDPNKITPWPYLPNTEAVRYTHARYLDLHVKVDKEIGQFIQQLKDDGLMDETIIFYYGDHGGVLPRSKGYVYESGLQTPMVVYVPEKWKHLFPAEPGSRVDGFVRFIDLAPTVLNLAGVDVPKQMDGVPFLGKGVKLKELNSRDFNYGFADRFDEKYDMVRAIRKGQFKYIRNYQPFNFDGLFNEYRYRQYAYMEWLEMYKRGELNEVQKQFFETRPAECLFDIDADPHEVNNLANKPEYKKQLLAMRKLMQKQEKGMPDLSFYPEAVLIKDAANNPVAFGQERKKDIAKMVDVADLNLVPFEEAADKIEEALKSDDPWTRYWGLIVCSSFGEQAKQFYDLAINLSKNDTEPLVKARAAQFLGIAGQLDPSVAIKQALKESTEDMEALLIMNMAVMLRDGKPGYDIKITKDDLNAKVIESGNTWVNVDRVDYLK